MSKLTATLTLILFSSLGHAAVIDGYDLEQNDRFVAEASFIGEDFDWSGVGITDRGRWGTLIGPNTVISAGHFAPSGSISFYADNRPGGAATERTIATGEQIADTDLWVGCLSQAVPDSIATYSIVTDLLTTNNFGAWTHAGGEAYIVGRSPSPHEITQNVAIGKNTIVGYGENDVFDSGLGTNVDTLGLVYDRPEFIPGFPNPDYIEFESHLEVGDSGAPLFAEVNGELVILGINSFITETTSIASHVSYVGNQSDTIHALNAECVAAIPEPRLATPLLLAAICVIFRLRRRSTDS